MSSLPLFDIAGSGLQAQSVRMSTIASNLANADTLTSTPEQAYRAIDPIFQVDPKQGDPASMGVRVKQIVQDSTPPLQHYDPGHPLADQNGYVYAPNVDPVAQMVNLISASRNYQANVEMINTAKELALATLTIGR